MIKKIILFCFALLILFSCNDEKSNINSKEFGKEKLPSGILGMSDKNNQDFLVEGDGKKLKRPDYDLTLPLEGTTSLFPTEPDHLKNGYKYKSLISRKRWEKRGLERQIESLPPDGDNWGRVYTLDDVGKTELKIAKLFNKSGQVLIELEDVPYINIYPWNINEYDEKNRVIRTNYSTLHVNIQPFTEDFYKELESKKTQGYLLYEYMEIDGVEDRWLCSIYDYDSKDKKQIKENKLIYKYSLLDKLMEKMKSGEAINIPNLNTTFLFYFNEKGLLQEIKPNGYRGWLCSNIDYDDNDRILGAVFDFGNPNYIEHYVFTKHDNFGNWLEADVYINDDEELSYTILREIEYY